MKSTALDSNIVIGLWNEDEDFSGQVEEALESAAEREPLVVSAPVYVEIRALQGRTEERIDDFLRSVGVAVEWNLEERIWRKAAKASYAHGVRRGFDSALPRRVSADFLIGDHAVSRPHVTYAGQKNFRGSFPDLKLAPETILLGR